MSEPESILSTEKFRALILEREREGEKNRWSERKMEERVCRVRTWEGGRKVKEGWCVSLGGGGRSDTLTSYTSCLNTAS